MSETYKDILITHFFDKRNSMEYWLPKMKQSGVEVPTTKFFDVPNNKPENVNLDKIIDFAEKENLDRLFIRSMYKSGVLSLQKGSIVWQVEKENIYSTIKSLIKQHQNNFARVPTGEKIAVREYIDCSYCPYYHDKTVKHTHPTETRFFIKDQKILYNHPTIEEIIEKNINMECTYSIVKDMLKDINTEKLFEKARKIAQEFTEQSWSVDFLLSSKGNFHPIDMGLNGLYYNKRKERWNNISGHKDDSEYNLMKKYGKNIPENYKKYGRKPNDIK